VITDLAGFAAAQRARQDLAANIFTVLLQTTMGATDPTTIPAGTPPTYTPAYNAARWLAQLSVNIVDFIDNDDIMTPFFWKGSGSPDVVFGTEIPRVVINEAYAEWTTQPTLGQPTNVQVWVELYNTFNTDPTLANNGDAALGNAAIPAIYQVALCMPDSSAATYYRRADNVWGTPYPIITGTDPKMVYPTTLAGGTDAVVNSWAAGAQTISASNGGRGGLPPANTGYYLVGPGAIAGGGPTPLNVSANMQYQVPTLTANAPPPAPTVMLQRLACPYLQPNPPSGSTVINPAIPYNPFITVDYMQNVDADATGNVRASNETTSTAANLTARQSDGRNQPYNGYSALVSPGKQLQTSAVAGQPQNTFFMANSQVPNPVNFDWLVQLDRQLTSPMELLHVSAYKPHELTQEFLNPIGAVKPYNHRVPWFDEDLVTASPAGSHRLYRFFEFVETHGRAAGLLAAAPTSSTTSITAPTPGQLTTVAVTPAAMAGVAQSGAPVSIQPGSVLLVDSPPNQELVVVKTVTPSSFTADFYKGHGSSGAYPIVLASIADRLPGKINLCTVWDPETFSAVCDWQSSNNFAQTDPGNILTQLLTLRNPGDPGATPAIPVGLPSKNDNPFQGLATGLYPAGDTQFPNFGINNTLLRAYAQGGAGNSARLFEVPPGNGNPNTHPFLKYQLLSKIFNNVTTRSNVFAVWLTVGFFEVLQDADAAGNAVRPVILGGEVGASTNQNVRLRMFALVDRSNLVVPGNAATQTAGFNNGIPVTGTLLSAVQPLATPQAAQISGGKGTLTITPPNPSLSWTWNIQAGSVLTVDQGATAETVVVASIDSGVPPTITATFTQPHNPGAPVTLKLLPGNPGPQPELQLRNNTAIVPYFSIIN
jgi:hypothetical protein